MRGRKPRPTALKLIMGNPGKHALNPHEPKPVSAIPTCPAHLTPTAKAEWKRLVHHLYEIGMLTGLDRSVLAVYCQSYGRWVEAERKLKETPWLLKTPAGYVQASPWLAISNKAVEQMHKYLTELGLSPVSRTRVTVQHAWPPPWEFSTPEEDEITRRYMS